MILDSRLCGSLRSPRDVVYSVNNIHEMSVGLVMMQQRDPQLAKIRRRAPIESNITNCNGITYFMCDGRTKTTFELLQSFYWPGMYSDVSQVCRIMS